MKASRAETQAQTRARVLEAADQIFSERSYSEATLKDVAKRAGVTTGAIYANFDSKANLFLAVVLASYQAAQVANAVAAQEDAVKTAGAAERPASLDEALRLVAVRYAGRIDGPQTAKALLRNLELLTLMLREVDGLGSTLDGVGLLRYCFARYFRLVALPSELQVSFDELARLVWTFLTGVTQARVLAPEASPALETVAEACAALAKIDAVRAGIPLGQPVGLDEPLADDLVPPPQAERVPPLQVRDVITGTELALRAMPHTVLAVLPMSQGQLGSEISDAIRDRWPSRDEVRLIIVLVDHPQLPGSFAALAQGLHDVLAALPASGEVLDFHIVLDAGGNLAATLGCGPLPEALVLDGAGLLRAKLTGTDLPRRAAAATLALMPHTVRSG